MLLGQSVPVFSLTKKLRRDRVGTLLRSASIVRGTFALPDLFFPSLGTMRKAYLRIRW